MCLRVGHLQDQLAQVAALEQHQERLRELFEAVDDVFVLTASFNIYFLRPISTGVMTARGAIVSRSTRLLIGEGVLVDSDGKEIARGSGTFMPSRVALDERLGYT